MFWRLFFLRRNGFSRAATCDHPWQDRRWWHPCSLGDLLLHGSHSLSSGEILCWYFCIEMILNPHIWKVDNDAHLMWCDGEEPVDQPDPWDGREEDKPEVEEHIDLETATVTQKSWWWITILYQRQKGWSWPIIIMVFKMVLLTMMLMQWFTFSLMMFKGRTQRASCFCRDPDGPNFWKVHFATWGRSQYHRSFNLLLSWTPAMTWLSTITLLTLGKTLLRGSSRTLIGSSICVRTSLRKRQMSFSVSFIEALCCIKIQEEMFADLPNSWNWYPRNMSVK